MACSAYTRALTYVAGAAAQRPWRAARTHRGSWRTRRQPRAHPRTSTCFAQRTRYRSVRLQAPSPENNKSNRANSRPSTNKKASLTPSFLRDVTDSSFFADVPYREFQQIGRLYRTVDEFLGRKENLLFWGSCALLFGAFSATSISTIVGALAEWDPIAGAVIVFIMEWIATQYYRRPRPSNIIRILNAYQVGLTFGFILDALKLAG
jgi:hypothetical protein